MRDSWLQKATPRGLWTWAELKRQFRALRVPADICATLCGTLQQWGASPDDGEPLLRLVRKLVLSNAVHRAEMKRAEWAAGTARDPHYKLTREEPGALRPLLDIVERVISDLEHLIKWEFNPPIELHERDAKHKPTHRTVHLSRLDEAIREAFDKARKELLWVRETLRQDTQRPRGRKATLVQPYRVSALSRSTELPKPARRRELARMVRAQLLALHPDRNKRPRAARIQADRLAGDIIASIPVLN
jgi:hypothetical protein